MAELTYNLEEAAKALGLSRPTMYKLVYLEGFPAWKVGARWVIPKKALLEWSDKMAKERVTV